MATILIPMDHNYPSPLPLSSSETKCILHVDVKIQVQSLKHCRRDKKIEFPRLQVPPVLAVHADTFLQYCDPLIIPDNTFSNCHLIR